jgi:hypothetical protein
MEKDQAYEEIRYIRDMIEKTRRSAAGSGFYLIVWGVLVIIAILGMHVLEALKLYNWIWVDWIVWMGLGVAITLASASRAQKKNGVQTYAAKTISYLWGASGVAFILLGFVFPLLGLYSWEPISIFVSVIAGVALFVSGGIFDWNLLKWGGLLFWIGSVVMVFCPAGIRSLVFIPLILFGYLLPGIVYNRKYRSHGEGHDS